MKVENYNKIKSYLDILEAEIDKVAAEVGHISFSEFMANKKQEDELKKAA